jgi:hypothetical protein
MQMFDTLTPLKSGLFSPLRPKKSHATAMVYAVHTVDRAFPVWGLGFLLQHRHSAAYFRFTTL